MPFRRYVSIGRVAYVNLAADPLYGKLVVIVDIVDQNRALVDSPEITRTVVNFKRLLLTDLEISIGKTPNKKDLAAALKEADVAGKFAASNWGKKLARQDAKKKATDFDRYTAMKAKVARSAAIKQKLGA